MKKIFYLLGRSGVGKTYVFNKLKSDPIIKRHCKTIVGYTTRPIRPGEVEGDEYNFITEEALRSLRPIEVRNYNVIVNEEPAVWTYATCADNIDIEDSYYIGIGTLESYQKLQEHFYNRFGESVVVPIYIIARDEDLLVNYLAREMNSGKNYDEMCRRFLADREDFSKEKLEEVGITNKNTYMNRYHDDTDNSLYNMIAKEILSEIILNEQRYEE